MDDNKIGLPRQTEYDEIIATLSREIPRTQNLLIMSRVKADEAREFYLLKKPPTSSMSVVKELKSLGSGMWNNPIYSFAKSRAI